MVLSVFICISSFILLVWLLRASQVSLGLPIAYLASLLLIHVPGAVAHILDRDRILIGRSFTELGIGFTAIASVCFLAGVALAHFRVVRPDPVQAPRALFARFALFGGWFATSLAFLFRLPSIGAVIERGGPIWMLAIILGLRSAFRRRSALGVWHWLGVLAVYPVLMLLIGGFLSYGIAAVMIVMCSLAVTARTHLRVAIAGSIAVVFGISVFLTYFEHRKEIRQAVWGGAGTDARIEASMNAARDISFFDPTNPKHLRALDLRLNQNYFAGLAAARIEAGKVSYLRGRSLLEGAAAIVPRALWPDKPVVSGSPLIVSRMTGLKLDKHTSFGVGNVMEFQINFGILGLVFGFLILGYLIGVLDRLAAASDAAGDLGKTILFFLPAVALIQPNGSIVEMVSGGAAAVAAGFGWRWAWNHWPKPGKRPAVAVVTNPSPHPF